MKIKLTLKDCGTGAGGFKPGNTCGAGGGGGGGGSAGGGSGGADGASAAGQIKLPWPSGATVEEVDRAFFELPEADKPGVALAVVSNPKSTMEELAGIDYDIVNDSEELSVILASNPVYAHSDVYAFALEDPRDSVMMAAVWNKGLDEEDLFGWLEINLKGWAHYEIRKRLEKEFGKDFSIPREGYYDI